MAKLKIYTYPDDVLAQRAKPIDRVEKTYFKVADDMLETMYEAPGIGLAANQVGVLERIIVVDTDYNAVDTDPNDPSKTIDGDPIPADGEVIAGQLVTGKKPLILINPEIIYKEGTASIKEACLSVPGYQSEVKRAEKIKVQYTTIDGLQKVLAADDLQAICLQHEIDHLEGTLFIDHLNNLRRKFAQKKMIQERKEREREKK
ncbi:MAG: peptide deformylase [Bdellovibrionales bacterium]|nr:peptide deformylase [Bdellovibrionales bacterium]